MHRDEPMINERQYIFLRVNMVLDMVLAMAALVGAYYTRAFIAALMGPFELLLPPWFPSIAAYDESHLFREYLWLFPTCAILWPMALNRWGYYDFYDFRNAGARRWIVVKASVLSAALLVLAIFVFKLQFISRIVVVGTSLWATLFLLIKEARLHAVFLSFHAQPGYQHNILVIAEGGRGSAAEQLVDRYRAWGLRIVRVLPLAGLAPDALAASLSAEPIDEVVFSVEPPSSASLGPLAAVCEQLGIRTRILLDVCRPTICKLSVDVLDGLPVLALNPTTQNFGALAAKVFIDRAASLVLLAALSPVLLGVALAIRRTSPGPVFIRQLRCGLHGRPFTMFKFRSMVENAEELKPSLESANELGSWAFKMANDPRITRVGRFLRRFSLDELPQLFNVLRGDMSLVGPRPALPDEVAHLALWERRRLSMKPGMTGLWQVSGRHRIPNKEWASFDLAYIDQWSLGLDLRILLRTLWVVLRGEGA